MHRRAFLQNAARAGLSTAPFLPRLSAARRPNVIVLLTDDQGYGDLSCHGNPVLKTPNMDRLHAESVRLTDFHAMPMCTPTRSQLMTGRYCLANGAMNVSSGRTMLRAGVPTTADAFAASGYSTGQFGKWHLGDTYPYRPIDRGFQESVCFPSSHIGSTPDYWNNAYYDDTYRHNGRLQKYSGYCTDVFFGEAMKWMEARRRERQPFFLYLPTNAPHGPFFVPDRYRQLYAGQPANAARFFGMLANLDENLGRLDAWLASTGLRDNTLLIMMNDNGATGGADIYNAGLRGKKIDLWDGGHRAFCFMRWPSGGLGGGRDIGELATVQDLFPTLIDLCGLTMPSPSRFDGASLAPLLHGTAGPLPDRSVIIQFSRMNAPYPKKGDAAVLWKKWRLVSDKELYDVARDPGQKQNVIEDNPEIAARLRAHYEEWWKQMEPELGRFEPVYIGSEHENPVLLSPTEWADVFLDQGLQIRRGERKNGMWHVMVERDGEYEFELRRWAREADAGMRAPLPPYTGTVGQYAAGIALPIARAGLHVGEIRKTAAVGPEDKKVVLRLPLRKGRTTIQTWFYDESGEEICGAYYVYAERRS